MRWMPCRAWFELGALKEDRLEVKVKRRRELESSDPEVRKKTLDGTIKSNLQLAGRYDDTDLAVRLKLREVVRVVLEKADPAKTPK